MTDMYVVWAIVVMAVVTIVLRFLPFLIFSGKETPKFLTYLGQVLPYAVMAMLVVYCLKDVTFNMAVGWIPAAVGVIAVTLLHIWKRNTLLSIIGGTVIYMVLIRVM